MGDIVAVAGGIALAGVAATVASLVYLHLAPTGLSPVHNAVSHYGITAYRSGYRAATISFGIAGAALAVGVSDAVHGRGSRVVVGSLVVFAVGRFVISWFPMDAPGSPGTPTGHAHGLIAIVTFGSATIAAFRLGAALTGEVRWHSLAPVSTGLAWAMVACIVGMALGRASPGIRSWFGAVERGLYVAMIGWFIVVAVACAARLA